MTASGEVEVWRSPEDVLAEALGFIEEWRQEAAHKRARRRMFLATTVAFSALLLGFIGVIGAIMVLDREDVSVGASETLPPPTSVPLSPEWGPLASDPPPLLVPESVPTSTTTPIMQTRVLVPGFDGLGRVLTDGTIAHRVLPGDQCRAVISIPFNPSAAATVIVATGQTNQEWRVFTHDFVSAAGLRSLTDVCPSVPTVLIVSSLPGDPRPFVEARRG